MAIFWQGFNVKASVTNFVASGSPTTSIFTIKKATVTESVGDGDVSNSEGAPGNPLAPAAATVTPGPPNVAPAGNQLWSESRINLLSVAEVTLEQPTYDSSERPFVAPRSVFPGNYIQLQLWLNTRAGQFWFFYSLLILSAEQSPDVTQLTPNVIRGKSDGVYLRPA